MNEQERNDWIKVAEKLGYRPAKSMEFVESESTGIHMLLCGDDATSEHTRETTAMLHGLACLRCNGSVWISSGVFWRWRINYPAEDNGMQTSHPAALLAMLEAHEGPQR